MPPMVTELAGRTGEATDSEVIAQSGQPRQRLGLLYHRHATVLYGYACQRVGASAAEDLVADTFLTAFAQRRRYELARSNARPWLFGILTNKIARHARTERIHYRAYARAWQEPVLDGVDERVAEQVTAGAQRARLVAALCHLRRDDRHVLLLVAWGQLTYEEVAEAMNIPVGTVKSRLNRARHKLREALTNSSEPTER